LENFFSVVEVPEHIWKQWEALFRFGYG
jgi:hypothetical protein